MSARDTFAETMARAAAAHIRAQRTIDEAVCLVVLRGRLPRGLKWLVGFPRVLGAYGRLRGWR